MRLDSAESPAVSQQRSEPPSRPAWVSEEFYDPQRGVKYDELGNKFKELNEFKRQQDELAAKRRAEMPEAPDGYGVLGEGDEVPQGFKIDPSHRMWKFLQEVALEKNLTKSEYKDLAKRYVNLAAESQKDYMSQVEAERKQLFTALGDNGAQRVDAVKVWFNSAFGEKVGSQLAYTLHTPDIVKSFEKIQKALTNQGASSFNGLGRDGVGGGDIEGWDKMTFEQRWAARSQHDRRGAN